MNETQVQDIMAHMRSKMTNEDLQTIWKRNDRREYSEEGFEAIRRLLIEHRSNVPVQDQPVLPSPKNDAVPAKHKVLSTVGVLCCFIVGSMLIFPGIIFTIVEGINVIVLIAIGCGVALVIGGILMFRRQQNALRSPCGGCGTNIQAGDKCMSCGKVFCAKCIDSHGCPTNIAVYAAGLPEDMKTECVCPKCGDRLYNHDTSGDSNSLLTRIFCVLVKRVLICKKCGLIPYKDLSKEDQKRCAGEKSYAIGCLLLLLLPFLIWFLVVMLATS